MAAALIAALTACSGPSVLVVGEPVQAPEPPVPMVELFVLASDDLAPIEGALVLFDDHEFDADATGFAASEWPEQPVSVEVNAPGFQPRTLVVPILPEEPIQVHLIPVILRGLVRGSHDRPLSRAQVEMNGITTVTDESGSFTIPRAVPGEIAVSRPAWLSNTAQWDGGVPQVTVTLEPRVVRGLRVSGPAAGDPARWAQILSITEESSVNALVVDTKDEAGVVMHDSQVPEARSIGAIQVFYDVAEVLEDMRDRDLYAITRVVVFQDDPLAKARPDLGVADNVDGGLWRNNRGHRWLDPTDQESWEYSLALAAEACRAGFDEIQFDYVRFPSDGPVARMQFDGGYTEEVRVTTITAFLGEATRRMHELGCAVSADVFAVTVSVNDDQGVGQSPEELSHAVDVISPMIYPTHYSPNWLGFPDPNDYPAEVVSEALDSGAPRLLGSAIMRPWLQTWPYGPTDIHIEINETEERDLGWMLWSANARFTTEFIPENLGAD